MKHNVEEYALLGIPGCVTSTDGVHVGWTNCPHQWRHFFTGKEKIPTLAYNVCVNHSRFIHAVTCGHPGARNDKAISELGDFLLEIRNDPKYTKYKFQLINKLDEWMDELGLWVLADGGYHRYLTYFMCWRKLII